MQFFLFVPLIVWLYCRKRSTGWLCTWILIIIHILGNMIVTYRYNLGITILDTFQFWDLMYIKPYCRVGAFAIGIQIGFMYFESKNGEKYYLTETRSYRFFKAMRESRCLAYFLFCLGFGLLFFCVFIQKLRY